MGDKIKLGALLKAFAMLARRHGAIVALLTLGLAAFDTMLELTIGSSFQLIGNIVSLVAGFFLLRHLLGSEGLIEREGSFGRYFGASLLSGLGTIAGLILLIIPGLFLAARWAVATSLAITRDLSANEALGASWALTKPSTGILMLLYAVLLTLYLGLAFGVGAGAAVLAGEASFAFSASTNLIIDLGMVLGVVLNVAIYIELTGRRTEAEAVFA